MLAAQGPVDMEEGGDEVDPLDAFMAGNDADMLQELKAAEVAEKAGNWGPAADGGGRGGSPGRLHEWWVPERWPPKIEVLTQAVTTHLHRLDSGWLWAQQQVGGEP